MDYTLHEGNPHTNTPITPEVTHATSPDTDKKKEDADERAEPERG